MIEPQKRLDTVLTPYFFKLLIHPFPLFPLSILPFQLSIFLTAIHSISISHPGLQTGACTITIGMYGNFPFIIVITIW